MQGTAANGTIKVQHQGKQQLKTTLAVNGGMGCEVETLRCWDYTRTTNAQQHAAVRLGETPDLRPELKTKHARPQTPRDKAGQCDFISHQSHSSTPRSSQLPLRNEEESMALSPPCTRPCASSLTTATPPRCAAASCPCGPAPPCPASTPPAARAPPLGTRCCCPRRGRCCRGGGEWPRSVGGLGAGGCGRKWEEVQPGRHHLELAAAALEGLDAAGGKGVEWGGAEGRGVVGSGWVQAEAGRVPRCHHLKSAAAALVGLDAAGAKNKVQEGR